MSNVNQWANGLPKYIELEIAKATKPLEARIAELATEEDAA